MSTALRKLGILVIDDNPNMVQIIRTILKAFGAVHIYEAADVAQAFTIVRQYAVDLVFLDYQLGFMDGIEFVRMIRTAPDSPNVYLPVIMLTAYSEQHRVEAARDAGVTEFCVKPVTAAEVHKKMVEVIDHPRPFVRAAGFFGPDRRRRLDHDYKGPERRAGSLFGAG